MAQQETRVTKVSRLVEKIQGEGEVCLVQIYPPGESLGRKWPVDEDELTVGRDTKNEIVVDLDNVSRRHAKFTTRDGKVFVCDLGSTNGTYLNDVEVHEETELRSGDLVKVGGSIFKFLSGANVEALYFEEIHRMAIVDGLTQIYNKRYLLEFMEREMARCHRYGRALSLIMFDIDHFKKINDESGHLAGDYVLRELAYIVKQRVRKEECFARYGGEEFAIVMPESGREKVRKFAEKLLTLVSGHDFVFEGKTIPVTVSIGVADVAPDVTEPSQFIKAADQMLYKAKHDGRNRVCG